MEGAGTPKLDDYLANALRRQSDELIERWVEWLTERIGLRSVRALPREAILDHVPMVLRDIAEFLRLPADAVKAEMVDHLRLHAQLRREQGYDIEELLLEYSALTQIVSEAMLDALREYPGQADPVEVAELFLRLREGLFEMSSATVGSYRDDETEHRRELATRLEEFGRTLTHEIKNPLNLLNMGAAMLEDERVVSEPEKRARYVQLIRHGLRRLTDLVDDIRMLTLSEGAQAAQRWVSLRRIVEAVFEETAPVAAAKEVRLEIAEPLPEISVDASSVEIAIMNFVTNGIKYSDPDKPERWVRVAAEEVDEGQVGRGWKISVADNGLGIPDEMQDKIFKRHFRAHPEVAEGTGLGLALARTAIEQHGGAVGFESVEGEGTRFHFTTPAQPTEAIQGDSRGSGGGVRRDGGAAAGEE